MIINQPADVNLLTGMITVGGAVRQYESMTCKRTFTLSELTEVYIAQAAVWNMYGYEKPWWSVLTSIVVLFKKCG